MVGFDRVKRLYLFSDFDSEDIMVYYEPVKPSWKWQTYERIADEANAELAENVWQFAQEYDIGVTPMWVTNYLRGFVISDRTANHYELADMFCDAVQASLPPYLPPWKFRLVYGNDYDAPVLDGLVERFGGKFRDCHIIYY